MAILISSVLGFLVLLAVSQAADPNCEDITKPLVQKDNKSILGKWILNKGISSSPRLGNALKMTNSSWMEFVPSSPGDILLLRRGSMKHGDCQYSAANISFQNSTVQASANNRTTVIDLLPSCTDCITMSFHRQMKNETLRTLFFLTKGPKASESELELYWEQAECLGLGKEPQFSYDGVTDLCHADESHSPEGHTKAEPEKSEKTDQ